MVLLLFRDVSPNTRRERLTHREGTIASLPLKSAELRPPALDPFGGPLFCFFHETSWRCRARQLTEDMNMILRSIDDQRGAVNRVQSSSHIGVQLPANAGVLRPGLTFLGGKDQMQKDVGEGLGHQRILFRPFRASASLTSFPGLRPRLSYDAPSGLGSTRGNTRKAVMHGPAGASRLLYESVPRRDAAPQGCDECSEGRASSAPADGTCGPARPHLMSCEDTPGQC